MRAEELRLIDVISRPGKELKASGTIAEQLLRGEQPDVRALQRRGFDFAELDLAGRGGGIAGDKVYSCCEGDSIALARRSHWGAGRGDFERDSGRALRGQRRRYAEKRGQDCRFWRMHMPHRS